MKKISYYSILFVINKLLKGTRFFKLKSILLNLIGIAIAEDSKVVGPLYINYTTKVIVGKNSWIGRDFRVDGNGKVEISDFCDLGPNVLISTGGHNLGTSKRRAGTGITFESKIEEGVWIGTNVLILNGATIGCGSVIAAGAVVNVNVEKNTLVAGVPAKIKRYLNE